LVGGFLDGEHARIPFPRFIPAQNAGGGSVPCGYPILSRNSSTALPVRFSFVMSRTVRSGWATYQPSAVIWYLAIQSFTCGLRIPGQPSHGEKRTSIWSVIFAAKSSI